MLSSQPFRERLRFSTAQTVKSPYTFSRSWYTITRLKNAVHLRGKDEVALTYN